MINPTESLLILQAQIEKEDSVEFDAKSIELKADDSKTIENEIISNLKNGDFEFDYKKIFSKIGLIFSREIKK